MKISSCGILHLQLERFNYTLHAHIDTARRGEKLDGRLVQHLNVNPSEDGGQWVMLVNIVEKYGVMPKKCFPEAISCEQSRRLNNLTNTKVGHSNKKVLTCPYFLPNLVL